MKNIAYIDAANLEKSLPKIDYKRFYDYLTKKQKVTTTFIFLGKLKSKKNFYKSLQKIGYNIIFKEAIRDKHGKTKANVDAELTLKATRDVFEYKPKQTILVSGDGDFASLLDLWKEKKIKHKVLAPTEKSCSYLLKKRKKHITILKTPKIYSQITKQPKQSIFKRIWKLLFKRI